jgi:hypothetical protein
MATLQVLQPGQRYKVAKSGTPSTTISKAAGVAVVPNAGVLRAVGDTITVADGYLWTSQPIEASVDLGVVSPSDGGVSIVSGATAALRRFINSTGTSLAPSAATDGFAVEGYAAAHIVLQSIGGIVRFHCWIYESVSGLWTQVTDNSFGTSGNVDPNNAIARVVYPLNQTGIERMYIQIDTNAGSSQANGWVKLVPQAAVGF